LTAVCLCRLRVADTSGTVAWIEYRDVPRPVMERFDESLERLMALDHENLVKGAFF
jgi:hypothetical protein